MNDLDLKNLLLETCPVRPGQEERAWAGLQSRLFPLRGQRGWSLGSVWRTCAYGAVTLVLALATFNLGMSMRPGRHALVFAESQSPGIYATSFYSHSAQAQVVWLNGMEPASDKPTYLDPTAAIAAEPKAMKAEHASDDPDSL